MVEEEWFSKNIRGKRGVIEAYVKTLAEPFNNMSPF